MKEFNFPKMTPADIEVRVGSVNKDKKSCTVLLYKNARIDMAYLDAYVGVGEWQREHIIRENIVNGSKVMVNYCKVSIWDEDKKQWVSKEDCGTESQTEPIKGESSDAFKRACFCWGIGRELYTAPRIIKINLTASDFYNDKVYTKFKCTKIGYDDNGNINTLEIVDDKDVIRYRLNQHSCELKNAIEWANKQTEMNGILGVWNACKHLQKDKEFSSACTEKRKEIEAKTNGTK